MDKEEDLLKTLELANTHQVQFSTKSRFNQPERLLVSSQQTETQVGNSSTSQPELFFYKFRVGLPRSIYGVKTIQLLRASIPNAAQQIPDGACVFWYYRLAAPGGVVEAPSLSNLYMVRLQPSYYKTEMINISASFAYNRLFQDYQDLATELAKACKADNINNSGTTFFIANDISITYNNTTNKFAMTGNDINYAYFIAGYADPNIPIKAALLQTQSARGTSGLYTDTGLPNIPGQPYIPNETLALRLGFTYDGVSATKSGVPTQLQYMFYRPIPYSQAGISYTTPYQGSYTYTADTYCDLVRTNIVSIYTDIVGGSTMDSGQGTNLLACIPVNTANLGVAFFQTTLDNKLTKVAETFDEVNVEMRDDYGQPYYVPNSAVVSLEIALSY
jgi:hypothetical protein